MYVHNRRKHASASDPAGSRLHGLGTAAGSVVLLLLLVLRKRGRLTCPDEGTWTDIWPMIGSRARHRRHPEAVSPGMWAHGRRSFNGLLAGFSSSAKLLKARGYVRVAPWAPTEEGLGNETDAASRIT